MRKRELSSKWQRLIEWMQWLNFGRIENLPFTNGEPDLAPIPRVVREFKAGAANGPRPEIKSQDFELRQEIVQFYEDLSGCRETIVETLEVKHGVPFRWAMEVTPGK